MIGRCLFLLILFVILMLVVIDTERQYRELQAIQARQVYQKQVLLEEQSRLQLELQRFLAQPRQDSTSNER